MGAHTGFCAQAPQPDERTTSMRASPALAPKKVAEVETNRSGTGGCQISTKGNYPGYGAQLTVHRSKHLVLEGQITTVATQYKNTQHKRPNNEKCDDPALVAGEKTLFRITHRLQHPFL